MKITPELIRKYLDNSCTAEEREAVDEWYQHFENSPDPLRLMNQAEKDSLQRSLYNRFVNNKRAKENAESHHSFLGTRLTTLLFAVTGVAALMLFFMKVELSNQPLPAMVSGRQTSQIAFRNGTYSIYKKVLPDNSTVWLSPNSSITYPEKFTGRYRNVSLTGEAFFEVTKDKKHPFIIASRNLTTKVWGTSFRIKSVENLPAEVAVVTGKVSVNNKTSNEEVMLLPNQKVTLVNNNHLLKVQNAATKNEMRIWKKVSLSFDDVQLRQVFTALNKNFNINIYSTDPKLNSLAFTGDFTDQNLPAILDMIKESVNASYTMEDGEAFIFKTNITL